ncbi:MAG: flagellar assembly protein FliW [Candidatus Kapabacteria bacterium]|nr:flagellar assembly protein FliW [Candidatus Kapabacteria bacterium]
MKPTAHAAASYPEFLNNQSSTKGFTTMVMQDEHMDVHILKTEQFGDVEVRAENIFRFADGVLGFEDIREYVLIADDTTAPIRWLISVEQPEIGFPVLSPAYIDPAYSAGKEYTDTQRYSTLVIVTLSPAGITANMKAPVVLDVESQQGKQVVLSSDKHSPNHPLRTQSRA